MMQKFLGGLRLGFTPEELEWQTNIQVSQHFNDLLMRLRSFGLPLLVTVVGASVGLSLKFQIRNVSNGLVAAIVTLAAVLPALLELYLIRRAGWGKPSYGAINAGYEITGGLNLTEKRMWTIPVLLSLGFGAAHWIRIMSGTESLHGSKDYSAAIVVTTFGLSLLVVLYALDRFYYYKLLLGSVNRSLFLEKHLGFGMTRAITDLIEPAFSNTVVTLIYFLPGTLACCFAWALLVFNPPITGG